MKGYRVPSTDGSCEGSGCGDSGQLIWKPVMEKYLEKIPHTSFKSPPSANREGQEGPVPPRRP